MPTLGFTSSYKNVQDHGTGIVHLHVSPENPRKAEDAPYKRIEQYLKRRGLKLDVTTLDWVFETGITMDISERGRRTQFGTVFFKNDNVSTKQILAVITELRKLCAASKFNLEAERVAAKITRDGRWHHATPKTIPTITGKIGLHRTHTMPMEIHHAIRFPRKKTPGYEAPDSLSRLSQRLHDIGITARRLSAAFSQDECRVRTSRPAQYDNFEEVALIENHRIREFFGKINPGIIVTTEVEQALGFWSCNPRSANIHDPIYLAYWERKCNKNDSFWVVTGNFLADVDPDVRDAMAENLSQGTKYTYFVQSHADVQRLRKLASKFQDSVKPFSQDLIECIVCPDLSLLYKGHTRTAGFYIINPTTKRRRGYRLLRSNENSGALDEGLELKQGELNEIVSLLSPLTTQRRFGGARVDLWQENLSESGVVMFTDLESNMDWRLHMPAEEAARILLDYDFVVSKCVSQCNGRILKSMGDGYMCFFRDPASAVRCASRLQRKLFERAEQLEQGKRPAQRISLAFGNFRIVPRGHGADYDDAEIGKAARLGALCPGRHILMTREVWENANKNLRWHPAPIYVHGDVVLKGFDDELPAECVELLWITAQGKLSEKIDAKDLSELCKKTGARLI